MKSALIPTILLVLVTLATEAFIMIFVRVFNISHNLLFIFDSVLLILIMTPFFYFLVYKPLNREARLIEGLYDQPIVFEGSMKKCDICHKVQTRDGHWDNLENIIVKNYNVTFLHSHCQPCKQTMRA